MFLIDRIERCERAALARGLAVVIKRSSTGWPQTCHVGGKFIYLENFVEWIEETEAK